jgi:tetratricopeptide (TPR) repeat protein
MAVSPVLSHEEIDAILKRAKEFAEKDDQNAAWEVAAPLLKAPPQDKYAAKTLIKIVHAECLSHEHALAALEEVDAKHSDDVEVVSQVAENLDQAIDICFLNAAPAEHPIFARVIEFLGKAWDRGAFDNEADLLDGLATAARLYGRQRDDLAERAHKRLIELDPDTNFRHYNYGLFLKTRGRFAEGVLANQRAVALSEKPSEGTQWNLGICATGAGHGEVALKIWKELGHKIEMGQFGLPEGPFPSCKVRLAQRPLAERTRGNDDPGQEETIWIERLSACHGIVRSVLYHDLGVDYGDVILFDGAPITYHKYDDKTVPVFPHMATLQRRNYQFFNFAGTQDQPERLSEVNKTLGKEPILYSHTDNFVTICANCWNDPSTNHARHEQTIKHVARGRIAAPPDTHPHELLSLLDEEMKKLAPCQLYAPDLCRAAGLSERAKIEQRRFDMLTNN